VTITLERAKDHLRVAGTEEDGLIETYMIAADAWLRRYTATNYVEDEPSLLAAELLLIGHLYANREAVSADTMKEVPWAVEALAGPFRTPTLV